MNKYEYVRKEVSEGQVRWHECHARGCRVQVPPAFFMCDGHWKLVPKQLKRQLWAHFVPGQEKGDESVKAAYLETAQKAIEVVAGMEEKSAGKESQRSLPTREEIEGQGESLREASRRHGGRSAWAQLRYYCR